MLNTLKPKKCKHCKGSFIPKKPLQYVCSMPCAIALENGRKRKLEKRSFDIQSKTMTELKNALQIEVNKIVLLIDFFKNCICCPSTGGKPQAGHYRTVKAHDDLRFNLHNIHKCCYRCNVELSGNISGYNDGLLKQYGKGYADIVIFGLELERKNKLTRDEIINATRNARRILKRLKEQQRIFTPAERMLIREGINNELFATHNQSEE
jgi:hypothetical protein